MRWLLQNVLVPLAIVTLPFAADAVLARRRQRCDACGQVAPELGLETQPKRT